jgi:DNA-binding NarL/FixJ family response regulator
VVNLDIDDFITETIRRAYRLLLESKSSTQSSVGSGYSARVQRDGGRGRPSFVISKEQLSYLIEQGFKVEVIGTMLGVSGRTVKRRMSTYGLSVSGI